MAEQQPDATAVERLIARRSADPEGRPLSARARQAQRSVEKYLLGGGRPRWMERILEIDRAIAAHRRDLERAHAALVRECGDDREAFAARWRAVAAAWPFGELNTLIAQHNAWYPIERDLPMNPRTGEYVTAGGRPYTRPVLDAAWVLEHFPAER
jgi:hypothetical protein